MAAGGLVIGLPRGVSTQSFAYTSIFPATVTLTRCDHFEVAVNVWDATGTAAFQFEVGFDGGLVEFESAELGDFLTSTGRDVIFPAPHVTDSSVFVGAASEPGPPAPSGDGALAILTFRATSVGEGELDLRAAQLVSGFGAVTAVTSTDGIVIVGESEAPACGPGVTPGTPSTPTTPGTPSVTPSATNTGEPASPTPTNGNPQQTPDPAVSATPTATDTWATQTEPVPTAATEATPTERPGPITPDRVFLPLLRNR